MDYSPAGSSVHVILQGRILEWIAISYSRGSSLLQGIFLTQGSNLCLLHLLHWQQILYHCTTWKTFVDHDGYSISSEGFLPAVVDIMVI